MPLAIASVPLLRVTAPVNAILSHVSVSVPSSRALPDATMLPLPVNVPPKTLAVVLS